MIDDIIERLLLGSDEYFGPAGKPSITVTAKKKYSYSTISVLRLRWPERSITAFVKVPTITPDNKAEVSDRMVNEYQILDRLHKALEPYPSLTVARPIAVFPDHPAMITEQCPGTVLQVELGKAKWPVRGSDLATLERHCNLAGTWLSRFHELTMRGEGSFDLEALSTYCEPRIRELVRLSGTAIDAGVARKIHDSFEAKASAIPEHENLIAGRHNGYTANNIIVAEDQLTVLDFSLFDYESTYYDVCNFWQKLDSMTVSPLFPTHTIRELQSAFLAGYGRGVHESCAGFRLVRYRYTLVRMLSIARKRSYSTSRGLLNRRLYAYYLDWLLRECGAI